MIEIVQAGQAGKANLLFDMHRLRARVFKGRLEWNVHVNAEGLEVDQFDLPEAIYLLALNEEKRVIGNWRLLPTTGPTMIRDIWPAYLDSLPMPAADTVWEASRFAVSPLAASPKEAAQESKKAVAEMFCALTELCMKSGIQEIFTLYDRKIAAVIRRLDCEPDKTSLPLPIDGYPCQIGMFKTDEVMLEKIRRKTGVDHSLLDGVILPQSLTLKKTKNSREKINA